MQTQPQRSKRKAVLALVSLIVIFVIIKLTVITTHQPTALWQIVASQSQPPPAAATIAGRFTTLLAGASLPSEEECASRVHRASWEPRTDNAKANQSVPTPAQLAQLSPWDGHIGVDPQADTFRQAITGNFTGTTDEILQWAACKWGFDEDMVRAEAVVESFWHQNQQGDYTNDRQLCPPGTWDGHGCYKSYGLLQLKYSNFQSTWPMSRDNSAFNVEYVLGVIRPATKSGPST